MREEQGFKVTPATSDPKDMEAARTAEKVLNVAPSRIVLQRAQRYWLRRGMLPSDALLRRWFEEESR